MHATIQHYDLLSSSRLDNWMMRDDSYIFYLKEKHSPLRKYDWNSRIILACTLYFNALEFITDDRAENIIEQTIHRNDKCGQILLAPIFRAFHEIDINDIPSSMLGRVSRYCEAIDWSAASPYPDDNSIPPSCNPAAIRNTIPQARKVIKVFDSGDGEYEISAVIKPEDFDDENTKTLRSINGELRYVNNAFGDVGGQYFSTKSKALEAALIATNYISKKWGYEFSIQEA